MSDNSEYVKIALELGFNKAAILNVKDLIIMPEYRKYCEENLCGNYGKLKACPPECGMVSEMVETMNKYQYALILQSVSQVMAVYDENICKKQKREHNEKTEKMLELFKTEEVAVLMMGAGPWKNYSCMSAYCIDAGKMAQMTGMKCWEQDGRNRYFSLLLF